jgi:hypothetical protein
MLLISLLIRYLGKTVIHRNLINKGIKISMCYCLSQIPKHFHTTSLKTVTYRNLNFLINQISMCYCLSKIPKHFHTMSLKTVTHRNLNFLINQISMCYCLSQIPKHFQTRSLNYSTILEADHDVRHWWKESAQGVTSSGSWVIKMEVWSWPIWNG